MKPRNITMKRIRNRAMTLVEIVLALGIIAVAIVPVIGTLGVALNTLRDSSEETSRAAIQSFVSSDLRARAYSTNAYSKLANTSSNILTGGGSTTYYFDAQGNWIATGTPSGADASRILYSATPTGAVSGQLIRYQLCISWPYPANANTKIMPGSLFSYE